MRRATNGPAFTYLHFPLKVFISHFSGDQWVATQMAKEIEGVGATTFKSVQHRALNDFDKYLAELRERIGGK